MAFTVTYDVYNSTTLTLRADNQIRTTFLQERWQWSA